jgi:hypothetical protein
VTLTHRHMAGSTHCLCRLIFWRAGAWCGSGAGLDVLVACGLTPAKLTIAQAERTYSRPGSEEADGPAPGGWLGAQVGLGRHEPEIPTQGGTRQHLNRLEVLRFSPPTRDNE